MLSTLSIGLLVGGAAKNSKQASVISCILYFPMLIFSGTTVPLEILPKAMQAAVRFFPFTMGVALMKETVLGIVAENAVGTVGGMIGVTVFCTALAAKRFKWE